MENENEINRSTPPFLGGHPLVPIFLAFFIGLYLYINHLTKRFWIDLNDIYILLFFENLNIYILQMFFAISIAIFYGFKDAIRPKRFLVLLGTFIAILIGIVILSSNSYTYFNENGIHHNSFSSFKEKAYSWKEVEIVEQTKEGYTFILEDGKEFEIHQIEWNNQKDEVFKIKKHLKENNILIKKVN